MTDLQEAINRFMAYYNILNSALDIQAVAAKHVVSQPADVYKDTVACFVKKVEFTGTPRRFVTQVGDDLITTWRYEPILTIRTVFTGENALNNSARHYERMNRYLPTFGDMSLIAWVPFVDVTQFFEAEYLIRHQSDARFLVYFDITSENEPLIDSLEETLNAYDVTFTDLLTSRTIEVQKDG